MPVYLQIPPGLYFSKTAGYTKNPGEAVVFLTHADASLCWRVWASNNGDPSVIGWSVDVSTGKITPVDTARVKPKAAGPAAPLIA